MKLIFMALLLQSIEPGCAWSLQFQNVPVKALPFASAYSDCLLDKGGVSAEQRIQSCASVRSAQLQMAQRAVKSARASTKVESVFRWLDDVMPQHVQCGTNILLGR